MATWGDFAASVCAALGVPASTDNVDALLGWFLGEQPPNGPNAAFNPLNIQEGDVGYGTSGTGQTNYGTYDQGVNATARVISQGNMSGILAAFRSGATCYDILVAVEQSPWASGHYGYTLHNNCATVQSNRAYYLAGQLAGVGGPSTPPPSSAPPGRRRPPPVRCAAPFTM